MHALHQHAMMFCQISSFVRGGGLLGCVKKVVGANLEAHQLLCIVCLPLSLVMGAVNSAQAPAYISVMKCALLQESPLFLAFLTLEASQLTICLVS